MKKNYLSFGKVLSVDKEEERFTLILEKKEICVRAYGDCCSESWFEYPDDLENLIGKRIFNIEHTDQEIDLPFSNRQEYDKNIISYIYTEKNSPTMFYLRNSSNGYYGGWFEIAEDDIFCPNVPQTVHDIKNKLNDISIHFNA